MVWEICIDDKFIGKYLLSAMTFFTEVFCSKAIFPIVANVNIPTIKLVIALIRETARVSCKKLLSNRLYDANIIIEPNAIPIELKIWDAALTQGFDCFNSSQSGLKKNLKPLSAPSRVRDRPRKTMISRKGSVVVMYRTFAEDFMLFHNAKYTSTQAQTKQAASSHRNTPGYSIPSLMLNTFFL